MAGVASRRGCAWWHCAGSHHRQLFRLFFLHFLLWPALQASHRSPGSAQVRLDSCPVTPLSGLWRPPQGGRRKTRTSALPLVVTSSAWERASPASERVGAGAGAGGREERTPSWPNAGRPSSKGKQMTASNLPATCRGQSLAPRGRADAAGPRKEPGSPLPTPSTAVTRCDGSRSSHSPTTRATSPFPTAISIF